MITAVFVDLEEVLVSRGLELVYESFYLGSQENITLLSLKAFCYSLESIKSLKFQRSIKK